MLRFLGTHCSVGRCLDAIGCSTLGSRCTQSVARSEGVNLVTGAESIVRKPGADALACTFLVRDKGSLLDLALNVRHDVRECGAAEAEETFYVYVRNMGYLEACIGTHLQLSVCTPKVFHRWQLDSRGTRSSLFLLVRHAIFHVAPIEAASVNGSCGRASTVRE